VTLPERLGRLRRVDRIGAGGFATVWLYHDDDLDSPVAVKALADNWAQRADVRERFLEEARMLRRADSEHVVRVYDIGEVDQTPYFVMSYADRGSLATLTDAGPVEPVRAVELIAQAGEGVWVLHRRGIIHRDIKPQNLLLRTGSEDDTEQVLVADLGVAKAMLHASGLTQVVGTPAYMAPEQAVGLGIDLRADVHALGAVAYHLMTGRLARDGGIGDLANPQRPTPPSRIDPRLAAYDDVLLRSLEPRPEDRWPDVASFVAGLRQAETRPVAATPTVMTSAPTLMQPAPPPEAAADRRRGRVLWPIALVLVLLLAGIGVAVAASNGVLGGSPSGGGGPTTTPTTARTGPAGAPTLQPSDDITYPPMGEVALGADHTVQTTGGTAWSYAAPADWSAYALSASGAETPTPDAQADGLTSVRWRPADEPAIGGYSVRIQAVAPTQTPAQQRAALVRGLPNSERQVTVLRRPADGLWVSYLDAYQHVRYNYFTWVPDAQGDAAVLVSVTGRSVDRPHLEGLLSQVVDSVKPSS